MVPAATAPTLELLAWIAERPRTYPETIEAWKSSCPRLTVWEDALPTASSASSAGTSC